MSQSDFVSRGQALVAAGQFQEAVKVCRLGLLGRPTTVEGRVVLGQALLALKRFDEVLAEMRVALELDHTSVAAQILKAEALLRKGDVAPAIETLHKARQMAPGDARILQLLGEAENGPSLRPSVTHPAVGFVGGGDTKHYPGHPSGSREEHTSLDSPGGARRSSQRRAAVMPEPALEGPDHTGTVEVDPELEGVEVEDDLDFDDLAAPPKAAKPAKIGGKRGAVVSTSFEGEAGTAIGKKSARGPAAKGPFDDEDEDELAETRAPGDAPARPSVRDAVGMPSGVIGEPPASAFAAPPRGKGKTVPPPRSKAPSKQPAPQPMPLGGPMPMAGPTIKGPGGPQPAPMAGPTIKGPGGPPAAPLPPAPRAPLAAALPTLAAQPSAPFAQTMVPGQLPPASMAAAARPTIAVAPAPPPPPPFQQEQLFGDAAGGRPSWGSAQAMPPMDPRSIAAANEPTARPSELDPHILALMAGQPEPNPAMALDQMGATPPKPAPKTGMRKRSRLQLVVWVIVGAVVIGGGVFAGFKIRAMRLQKEIVAARSRATDLAKADTWKGWREARTDLAGIVDASPTAGNRAALARTRALVAFEFGDGLADAKSEVDALGGEGGLDAQLAAAYLALAQSDMKAAKTAADAALAAAANDPAAHYVAGHVALLAGDPKSAATHFKAAWDGEQRPLYGVGLARAQAAAYSWDDAIATLDKVLAATPDHPTAVLARGWVLAHSGRIFVGSALGNDVRAQLDRITSEGKRPLTEQQHGVSPTQVAFGYIVLGEVDFLKNEIKNAQNDLKLALAVNLDDQRFAEDLLDTLYEMADLTHARSAADQALRDYPTSRRARIALARIMLAQGRAADAIDILDKQADVMKLPDALALRGEAQVAAGDPTNGAADYEAALKLVPHHEPAAIGRAWLELAMGQVDAATKHVAELYNPKGSSAALTTVYAATLRRSADAPTRDKAKELLDKIVAGPPSLDVARAQLELGRLFRDAGDMRQARPVFAAAALAGLPEAQLEYGLLLIEDRDPTAGRTQLDKLVEQAGERPSPQLVLEAARARMLAGDHVGAQQLLDLADKMPSVERWKLDRERGRLFLRKSDFPNAAAALTRALDKCGSDGETFLLAADVGLAEKPLADKVKKLAPERLKGMPEAKIVEAKSLVAAEKFDDAEAAYRAAKEQLSAAKASNRRLAQADFGLALVTYSKQNFTQASQAFELVIEEDPSFVDAYIFAAEIPKTPPKRAYELAQRAVQFNPDYAYAWQLVGEGAARMRDKKMLADAINRLTQIAPNGDELKKLKELR